MGKAKILIPLLVIIFLFCVKAEAQFRRKKVKEPKKTDIETPKKRKNLRESAVAEKKIKVKKTRNYIEKKSKRNSYKIRVSPKSNETKVPIENRAAFSRKTDRHLRKLKKAQQKAEKIATKATQKKKTPKRQKKEEERLAEKVASKASEKKKTPKRQKKELEKQEKTIADSEGRVRLKKLEKQDLSEEKVTQKIKLKSPKRQKKEIEKQENIIANSEGNYRRNRARPNKEAVSDEKAITYKTKSVKRQRKEVEKRESKIATSDGPVTLKDRNEKIAKTSHQYATFGGNIALRKSTKDMHPTVKYIEGRKQKTPEEKEKLRKKELKRNAGRNDGQPKVVTEKRKKPKYDTRESEIWYE